MSALLAVWALVCCGVAYIFFTAVQCRESLQQSHKKLREFRHFRRRRRQRQRRADFNFTITMIK